MNYSERLEADRRKKVDALRSLGVDPYGNRTEWASPWSVRDALSTLESGVTDADDIDGEPVECVLRGRVVAKNNQGKLKFFFLQDVTGEIQLMFSKASWEASRWDLVSQVDVYDHIEVKGKLTRTKTGEPTLLAADFAFMGKCVTPPPEKHHGVKDEELLVRQRYLAMIQDKNLRDRLIARSRILHSLRENLKRMSYTEVETPVLSSHAQGADAKPFVTHHNALGEDFSLRIAPELDLKRLLVGGLERVYELGKVFRNEGISPTHNPEFTILECYEAYADCDRMMRVCERLIQETPFLMIDGAVRKPERRQFRRESMKDLFFDHLGLDVFNPEMLADACVTHKLPSKDYAANVDHLLDVILAELSGEPLFVTGHPAAISPLARRRNDLEADRFELYVFTEHGPMEIANGYSELNDPDEQYKNLYAQAYSQEVEYLRAETVLDYAQPEQIVEGAVARIDHDYIHALKVGMPMAGGLGIGVDRLVMWLTGCATIRDVLAFPLVKTKKG